MVVQSTQDRPRRNASIELNGSEGRGILVQKKMRSPGQAMLLVTDTRADSGGAKASAAERRRMARLGGGVWAT
jgi:hypothetical protein